MRENETQNTDVRLRESIILDISKKWVFSIHFKFDITTLNI